jgi:serine/threonine protein kinase
MGVSTSEPFFILTEYVENGTLLEYLQARNRVSESRLLKWILDIAAGMDHLHKEGIIHRDLAARNLLLTKMLEIKITDFGFARDLVGEGNNAPNHVIAGPLRWMAPESLSVQKYSIYSDVWSFGIGKQVQLKRKISSSHI